MNYRAEDHTFAICAYGESAYIEECIRSLESQSLETNIIMCTSTPSDHLYSLAEKHGIRLYVNEERKHNSNIATDWNFAVKSSKTPLVTIAHQDDVYKKEYAKKVIEQINRAQRPLIAFTDYSELRREEEVSNIRNLEIKRIMLWPLRNRRLWGAMFVRRRILSLGSPICCPSVTYVKDSLPDILFDEGYKVSIDWQAWERFSRIKGDFVFVNDVLMVHRIHEDSETTKNIDNDNRMKEDYEMFCKFWPAWIAGIIEHWYKRSEDQNHI